MTVLLTILTVLSSFLANLETKTLKSDFTLTVSESANSPLNYPGAITLHGRQFVLTMFGLDAAYDGETLYMYSGDTDELTLSTPTEQELLEANPFLYAQALVNVCHITEHPVTETPTPVTLITLTPKDQSIGINKFTLKVRTEDLMPLSIELKEKQKTTTVRLNNPQFISTEPSFIIVPDKDTYINDMRL